MAKTMKNTADEGGMEFVSKQLDSIIAGSFDAQNFSSVSWV